MTAFSALYTSTVATISSIFVLEEVSFSFSQRTGFQVTAFVHSRYSKGVAIDLPDLQIFFEGSLANCSITGLPGEPSHEGGPTPFR